jgi:hypothetical protein
MEKVFCFGYGAIIKNCTLLGLCVVYLVLFGM